MASKFEVIIKRLSNKRKVSLFIIIGFFIFVVVSGISSVYAYYHESLTTGILANKVGDFDSGDGDINILIYKIEEGTPVRVYAVPEAYYRFNDELTSCTNEENKAITCNDESGNCEYSYDSVNKSFSLTSNQKISCKFYFEPEAASDMNVYVYIEDENGEPYTYSETDESGNTTEVTKNYTLVQNVPAYGYEYTNNYRCDKEADVTYDTETRKFTVSTSTKNNCYVYFNSVGSADITANVYVQSTYGSDVYDQVNSIPTNRIYVLNESKSYCHDSDILPTYVDGYINISATEKLTCDVYLDLQEE